MALVDLSATAEDNLLDEQEAEAIAKQELRYRDHQLERFKDEVPDLEDFNESVTLSEFNLDDFRMDLTAYIEANRTKLEEAPLGLYSIVPINPDYPAIREGVIFAYAKVIPAQIVVTSTHYNHTFGVYPRRWHGEI